MVDVAIIGCGVVGAAAAFYLARSEISVLVLEAENDVAMGTSKANSAILHAGYDPEPGTAMAELNVRGSALAKEICARLDVPYAQIGSLVLAFSQEECAHLQRLLANGLANGVPGICILDAQQVRKMEPNLADNVAAALYAPSAAVVSPWEYALAMAENAVDNGAEVRLNTPVTGLAPCGDGWRLLTPGGEVRARFVVNAAGVKAQQVHEMAAPPTFATNPCRGEYYLLDKAEGSRVDHVIFQCPTALGKGVLVSPTVHGNLIVGPNAENGADSTACTASGLQYVAEMAKKSVPGVDLRQSIRNFAGVRANTDRPDFVMEWAAPGFLDLAGMKSPGLSAAAAVGQRAAQMLEEAGLEQRPKHDPVTTRKKVRFKQLSPAQQAALVAEKPEYGRVICRCETVTEGEILAACRESIPPSSIDGVKRRAGAGMGRCQGGFCGPRVMEILCRERGLDPLTVTQDQAGSYILTGKTRQGGGER